MKHTTKLFLFCAGIFSVTPSLANTDAYDSGRAHLKAILFDITHGIPSYHKRSIVHYAQVRNIASDLNTKEIAKFFGCKTEMGQLFLEHALNNPLSPKDTSGLLEQRKKIIKTLLENPALKREIDSLLEEAKAAEQAIVQLLSDFFKGKTCPELQELQELKKQNHPLYGLKKFLSINTIGRCYSAGMNIIGLAGTSYVLYDSIQHQYKYYKATSQLDLNPVSTFLLAYYSLFGGVFAFTTYKDYILAKEKRDLMHALYIYIVTAEKINSLCEIHQIPQQWSIKDVADNKVLNLIKSLKISRYSKENTWVFLYPLVHGLLYNIYEFESPLAPIFLSITELDACNAIATKMLESQDSNNQLCFATIFEHDKSLMRTKNFWNVLVKNAVPNDIAENKNVLLTGPNAGGKTTSIRAILQNLILAQSFYVAAAETFEYTMFDTIHSYLTISDDILNGLSLFASEVKRAQEIVEVIKTLPLGHKFFFALDELFTGTAAESGEQCAYEFVKRIADFDTVQFIYATHFHKLKDLGNEHSRCANYKVDAPWKNAHGMLQYPFTLSKGASDVNVALDLARQAKLFE